LSPHIVLLGSFAEDGEWSAAQLLLNPKPERLPLTFERNLSRHFDPSLRMSFGAFLSDGTAAG